MSATTLTPPDADFERATGHLRPELLAHCYRLLGSVVEAEDQVQEVYLRAWRAFHRFEGRSSVRTWMYTIATNTCMTALKAGARRPMPTGLGQPASDPVGPLASSHEVPWLEPLPEAVLWSNQPADPSESAVAHEGVGLALVAALQDLPPLQRAALVLRDVLLFSAAEAAGILGCSVAACNSALQRARTRVGSGSRREGRKVTDLTDREQQLYRDFMDAFARYDVPAIVHLLADDATWEMPPYLGWYVGSAAIGDLIRTNCPARCAGDMRLVPTTANGQPAAAVYMREADGVHRAFQLQVLDIVDGEVTHVAVFFDLSLFALAGLPAELPAD
jgi:RNA polymerase sigma-70 factor (ECF subfamily)